MKKKVIVISLGGSLIVPDEIDFSFLKKFKKILLKNTKKHKFVIICGGGKTAREYISALDKFTKDEKKLSFIGLSSTRLNSFLVNAIFNQNPWEIPYSKELLKKALRKKDIVFYTEIEYKPNATSDTGAAELASFLNADFINLTNVHGLYNKNPKKHKNAKLISEISLKKFNLMAEKIKYKPGMHFVLDPRASRIILKNKVKTYILGKKLKNLDNLLKGKKFKGTTIEE